MKSNDTGLRRIFRAFQHSIDGIIATFRSEPAFRQDIILCVLAAVLSCFLDVSTMSRIIMLFSLSFIIIAELVNTALETIIDRISPDKHPLSKKAKDIGSAIVMITIICVCALWVALIFLG
ncbi:MAG: diacylglycerol kinase [Alphaproteobacteria bacterium]|nr:diacylglycerol kinase [Alphaproteobacteria bacterium]